VTELLAIPVEDDDGAVVVFEVDAAPSGDALDLASDGHERVEHARASLEKALADLRPTLKKLRDTIQALAPKKAEIEFGLKFGGETGIIIAKGTSEVNFRVQVSWEWD
jgi:Trypsin-co-occurring domain 1